MAKQPQPAAAPTPEPEIPGADDIDAFFEANAALDGDGDSPESEWDTTPPSQVEAEESGAPPAQPAAPETPAETPAAPEPGGDQAAQPPEPAQPAAFDPSVVPEEHRAAVEAIMAGKPPPGMVPQQAMDAERHNAREARQQAQSLNQAYQSVMQLIQGQQQPGQQHPAAEPLPDFSEDPAAHLKHRIDAMEGRMPDPEAQRQASEQATQVQQLQSAIGGYEQQFEQNGHPDYDAALSHSRAVRSRVLEASGYTKQQIPQIINQQELMAAAQALQSGRDPAEAAYDGALALGYAKAEPTPDPTPPAAGGQPPAAAQPDGAQTLATIAAGTAQAQSAGGGGGPAAGVPQSLEEVAAMMERGDKDFERHFRRMVHPAGSLSFMKDLR